MEIRLHKKEPVDVGKISGNRFYSPSRSGDVVRVTESLQDLREIPLRLRKVKRGTKNDRYIGKVVNT